MACCNWLGREKGGARGVGWKGTHSHTFVDNNTTQIKKKELLLYTDFDGLFSGLLVVWEKREKEEHRREKT
jgi:hypothetical protein